MTLRGGIDVAFLVAGVLAFVLSRANGYQHRWLRRPDPMPRVWMIVGLVVVIYVGVAVDAVRHFS
jgi:hypothetical protein